MPEKSLPIWEIHSQIIDSLRAGNRLILSAPTGSGKTTQVPQMLLQAGLLGDGQVVILQPRRLAARLLATETADEDNDLSSLIDDLAHRAPVQILATRTRIADAVIAAGKYNL